MSITTERIAAAARKLCEAPGPSGRECAAYAAAKELLSPMGEVKRTPLGSLLCCVNEGKEGAPHLLLEAHLDQIGFIVTRVEEGFLRFSKVGGIDARWLPATPVVIHAAAGDYPGIITSVPPHLAGGWQRPFHQDRESADRYRVYRRNGGEAFCPGRYCDLCGEARGAAKQAAGGARLG